MYKEEEEEEKEVLAVLGAARRRRRRRGGMQEEGRRQQQLVYKGRRLQKCDIWGSRYAEWWRRAVRVLNRTPVLLCGVGR